MVLAGTVLGLTIKTAVQNGRLVRDLAAVREKTSTSSSQQQTSLDKVMEIQSQVTRVEAGLADIKSNQDSLRTALTSLEAARTSDAAQWQERLSRVEVATREGIAEVTSRMDREEGLASSVNKLLPLLQPSSSTAPEQTESETPP